MKTIGLHIKDHLNRFGLLYKCSMLLLLVAATASCDRIPLYEMEKRVDLELELNLDLDLDIAVDVDVDVAVETLIEIPEMMQVGFYTPDGDVLQNTQFVGPNGGSITTPPGTYRMVIYSFGNEYTQVRGEGSVNTLEAFTSDITSTKMAAFQRALQAAKNNSADTRADEDEHEEPVGVIVYAPDHLLVTVQEVTIPEFTMEKQTITINSTVETICETYTFEVHTLIGAEYIESCEAFVTNQARTNFFGRGEISQEPAIINFPVGVNRRTGFLYTTFNTFGKLPGESKAFIHFIIRDTSGQEHFFSTEITDQFEKPDHHIVIEEPVEVPEPETTGGIAPTVEEWNEENHNVDIG